MELMEVVRIDPEIMSGEPCFPGTRVPVEILVDYLAGGDSLDFFLDQYPTVSRQQAEAFIRHSAQAAVAEVERAA
jgi:uncharacterized protein (DUF433 family)